MEGTSTSLAFHTIQHMGGTSTGAKAHSPPITPSLSLFCTPSTPRFITKMSPFTQPLIQISGFSSINTPVRSVPTVVCIPTTNLLLLKSLLFQKYSIQTPRPLITQAPLEVDVQSSIDVMATAIATFARAIVSVMMAMDRKLIESTRFQLTLLQIARQELVHLVLALGMLRMFV